MYVPVAFGAAFAALIFAAAAIACALAAFVASVRALAALCTNPPAPPRPY